MFGKNRQSKWLYGKGFKWSVLATSLQQKRVLQNALHTMETWCMLLSKHAFFGLVGQCYVHFNYLIS